MIDLQLSITQRQHIQDIGIWLDINMPNPPLPEPQRWSIGYSKDGREGIQFTKDADATIFLLRWP